MSQIVVYKLEPRSTFHFGERGVGIEETGDFLHSDTLFAAIASAWRVIGNDLGKIDLSRGNDLNLLVPFRDKKSPPFLISSAFPYAGDILFLPRPQIKLGNMKQEREIEFLSQGTWQGLCHGRQPSENELIQGGHVWVTAEEREQIVALLTNALPKRERERRLDWYRSEPAQIRMWSGNEEPPVPRISVDRVTSRAELYHQANLRFATGCGLYFWAEFLNLGYKSFLETALGYLEDAGLGGRRTSGHGQFRFHLEEHSLSDIPYATHRVTLSLYHPSRSEVDTDILQKARYELIQRRGWIDSPEGRRWRHRSLRMLAEGSVFPIDMTLTGSIEDAGPLGKDGVSHPVWRYGLALTSPVRLEGDL